MIVYVTGGAGFLGSHLVDRFLADGHTVVAIDNLVTGRRDNLQAAFESDRFTFLEADVSGPWSDILRVLPERSSRPNLILHFASPASPADYANDPLGTMRVNGFGAAYACDLAQETGARLLFASTSESYGDPLEHPQRETYWGNVNPVGLRACYDESKRFAEAYVTSAVRTWGIDGRLVRIFNTYGPRMQPGDGRVIPSFCTSALRGDPFPIYGDGLQTRSFCYVDDLIAGIVRLATGDGMRGEVVNLGSSHECSIAELARIVADVAGVPLRTRSCPLPSDDPARRKPDITKAQALLNWQPCVGLRQGLTATLDYFRRAGART